LVREVREKLADEANVAADSPRTFGMDRLLDPRADDMIDLLFPYWCASLERSQISMSVTRPTGILWMISLLI
jgi:hypothetical protein